MAEPISTTAMAALGGLRFVGGLLSGRGQRREARRQREHERYMFDERLGFDRERERWEREQRERMNRIQQANVDQIAPLMTMGRNEVASQMGRKGSIQPRIPPPGNNPWAQGGRFNPQAWVPPVTGVAGADDRLGQFRGGY